MNIIFFKFRALPDEVKALNKIRSKERLDCVAHSGDYEGLTILSTSKIN